jgi:small GTP-binding protein
VTNVRKILVVGLDQAGKTSILNILTNKFNLMDNLKPTAGIERTEIQVLGIPILSWDLGGHDLYREGYLKDIKIFVDTDSLFYVVDAINAKRYDESLQYYSDILSTFKKLDIKPKIVLCLHKVDPNIRDNPNTKHLLEDLKKAFQSRSGEFEITTFITSIYDRKSIIESFSRNFQELIVSLKPFKKLLETLVRQLNLDGLVLFDENLMILSEFYRDLDCEQMCLNMTYNSVYYMSQSNPQMMDSNFAKNFEFILNLKNKQKRFNFVEVQFKEWRLYLLTTGDKKIDSHETATKFNSIVKNFAISESD